MMLANLKSETYELKENVILQNPLKSEIYRCKLHMYDISCEPMTIHLSDRQEHHYFRVMKLLQDKSDTTQRELAKVVASAKGSELLPGGLDSVDMTRRKGVSQACGFFIRLHPATLNISRIKERGQL